MLIKFCGSCLRELPANKDYYFKKKDTKDGFAKKCKECQGYNFTDKLTKIPKEGCKFCIRCNRELLNDNRFFPEDATCKDGLRNVCRECGKDGKFMNKGYVPKRVWSEEENNLFIKRYPLYTTNELIELFYHDETKKTIIDRAFRLNCTNTKTDSTYDRSRTSQAIKVTGENSSQWMVPKSDEVKRKISLANKEYYRNNPHPSKGVAKSKEHKRKISMRKKEQKVWVGSDNPRHKDPLFGERNGRWEGGIKEIYRDLRDNIQLWKQDSMRSCNYKCVITGENFDAIHHLTSFRLIVDELFERVDLPVYKTIGDYTEAQRAQLIGELQILHVKHGLGVCLRKDVHKLFHDLYGYTKNMPWQFDEFIIRCRCGEFEGILNTNIKYVG